MNASTADTFEEPANLSDLSDLSTERLEPEITTFAAHVTAAMCRWLLLVAEFDRRCAYEAWECLNTAQWLNLQVGISLNAGRQHVAVARQIERLPAVRMAFSRGELSYSRVRAVCRVAEPDNEAQWLDVARHATASQLDRIVSDTIRATRAAEPSASAASEDERSLSWLIHDNGMYQVRGYLAPEVGSLLAKLVGQNLGDDRKADLAARRADALATILACAAAQPVGPDESHVESPPVLVVVHRYPNGTSKIEGGPAIPGDVADRLACDSDQIVALHTADQVRYERRPRAPTVSMRRYLEDRDAGCRFPGCEQRSRLHAHHVRFFTDRGATDTDNLVMLCPRHHGAIHHRGWSVSGSPEDGSLSFRDPRGRTITNDQRCSGRAEFALAANHGAGVKPTASTIRPQGGGGRYDHHLAVSVLSCNQTSRSPQAPPT